MYFLKVGWNVPEEERGVGDAGKLSAADLEFKEHQSQLANVGKLKVRLARSTKPRIYQLNHLARFYNGGSFMCNVYINGT